MGIIRTPRVYVSRELPPPALALLRKEGYRLRVNRQNRPPSRAQLLRSTHDCDAVLITLNEKIDEQFLSNAPRLKVVSSYSVGLDHIDVEACTRRGVLVTNTPDVLTEATADFAFALILATARRVVEGDRFIRQGKWNAPWAPMLFVGEDVAGATLGIVGFGRIGQAVAARASGFGMRVLYYNRSKVPPKITRKAERVPLKKLLQSADIVSVHLPLTPRTRKFFGRKEFSLMKKSAIFVNTARGAVVDQQALLAALRNKKIFGAGLDVFEKEPIAFKDPLLRQQNVVLAPHLGSASVNGRRGMSELSARNLIAALKGQIPMACVNRKRTTKT